MLTTLRACCRWYFLILLIIRKVAADADHSGSCGVYLAQSTIPGAGLGMFTGKQYEKGEMVTDGDIVIPLLEVEWHNGQEDINFIWNDYIWGAFTFPGMEEEVESTDTLSGASPGIGAAVNCMLSLVNVEDTYNDMDNAGLHRSRDPGAGAITPYHNRKSRAIKYIPAGQEIYISYGYNYFSTRQSVYGNMPFDQHYERADRLVSKYMQILASVRDSSTRLRHSLWDLVLHLPWNDSQTMNALPRDAQEVDLIAEVGTANQYFNRSIRSLDWLEENGKCMDNIRPGRSSIPQAGRGAFATRFIPQDGVVAPAPLIQIPQRSHLFMYDALPDTTDGHLDRNMTGPVHHQLLLNYCFGHRDSTLLLSPYGSITSLINHCSEKPNTRIQWAVPTRNPEWFEYTVEELEKLEHAGLSFDFIALRDIQPGEEILIDYGDEWVKAWEDHVRHWKPPKGSERYDAAYELNGNVDLIIRTVHELPYASSLTLYIYNEYRRFSGMHSGNIDFYRCNVLDRYTVGDETMYMVETFLTGEDDKRQMSTISYDGVLFGVPRDAFVFEDATYSRDHHMQSSFRHEMMIPDDMFPQQWKNMRDKHDDL